MNDRKEKKKISAILKQLNIPYICQYRLPVIPALRYDFYFIILDQKYLVEYDGAQHFQMNHFRRSEEEFFFGQNLDRLKTYIAIISGCKIVRIDYTQLKNCSEYLIKGIGSLDNHYFSRPEMYEYLTKEEIPDDVYDRYVIGEIPN